MDTSRDLESAFSTRPPQYLAHSNPGRTRSLSSLPQPISPGPRRTAWPLLSSTTASLRGTCRGGLFLAPAWKNSASAAGGDPLLAAATARSYCTARPHGRIRPAVPPPGRCPHLRCRCRAQPGRPAGLHPVGAALSMLAVSAAQVLLAWKEPDTRLHRGLHGANFTATTLSAVRRRRWAQSVAEREAGVASISAPVWGPSGRVVAAVSISGPIERMGRQPGRQHSVAVVAAANRLTEVLKRSEDY